MQHACEQGVPRRCCDNEFNVVRVETRHDLRDRVITQRSERDVLVQHPAASCSGQHVTERSAVAVDEHQRQRRRGRQEERPLQVIDLSPIQQVGIVYGQHVASAPADGVDRVVADQHLDDGMQSTEPRVRFPLPPVDAQDSIRRDAVRNDRTEQISDEDALAAADRSVDLEQLRPAASSIVEDGASHSPQFVVARLTLRSSRSHALAVPPPGHGPPVVRPGVHHRRFGHCTGTSTVARRSSQNGVADDCRQE